jgi:FkbM family methyltransferase
VRSGGAPFLLNYRNYVDRQIAFYDDFEAEQLKYLLGCIGRFGCTTFIDIGANLGFYSVHIARNTPVSRFIAFEPHPRNFEQLRANLFLNALSTRVEVHRLALSNKTGKVRFEAYPETSTGQSKISAAGGMEIDAARLDDVLVLQDARLAIKIDIEGHEAAAVEGMRDLLATNHCLIQAEVFSANIERFRTLLTGLGYRELHAIDPERYFTNFP